MITTFDLNEFEKEVGRWGDIYGYHMPNESRGLFRKQLKDAIKKARTDDREAIIMANYDKPFF